MYGFYKYLLCFVCKFDNWWYKFVGICLIFLLVVFWVNVNEVIDNLLCDLIGDYDMCINCKVVFFVGRNICVFVFRIFLNIMWKLIFFIYVLKVIFEFYSRIVGF